MPRVAALVAGLLVLVGCSDSEPAPEESSASDTGPAVDPTNVSPQDLPAEPPLTDAEGIFDDVVVAECTTTAPLTASGTVTNSAAEPADLVIVVNWTNERSDVLARAIAVLEDAPPGQSLDWSAQSPAAVEGELSCIPNAQRGTLPG